MATRCCSPPESSCGNRPSLPSRPTVRRASGTASWMKPLLLPMTCSVKATLAKTVLLGSSRKSWNTTPRLRRKYGTLRLEIAPRSCPSTWMDPLVGFSSLSTRRRNVDLPEPEAPTRNTNSPLRISRLTPLSAGRAVPRYTLVTSSKRIIAIRVCGRPSDAAVRHPAALPFSAGAYSTGARLRHLMPAAMKPSRSPSKTAEGLLTSYSVRRSLTI